MDLSADAAEAVVGEDDQGRVVVHPRADLADGIIDAPIEVHERRREARVLGLHLLPKEVMQPVGLHDVGHEEIPALLAPEVPRRLHARLEDLDEMGEEVGLVLASSPRVGIDLVAEAAEGLVDLRRGRRLLQVRAEKAADDESIHLARRVGDRDVHREDAPPRLAEAVEDGRGANVASGGDVRSLRPGVAIEEPVDVVLARVHPGHERCPRHRRHVRDRCVHLRHRSALGDRAEIRQLTGLEEALDERERHAVECDHKHSRGAAGRCLLRSEESHAARRYR